MSDPDTSSNNLRQSLLRLQTELAAHPKLDEDSRRSVHEVLSDLEQSLRDNQAGAAAAPHSRLEALAVRFEVGHPTVSASLREFIQLLGSAGV